MSNQWKDRAAWDELDRALLGSARLDEPPPGSRAALERALGLESSLGPEQELEGGRLSPTSGSSGASVGTLKSLVVLAGAGLLVGVSALYVWSTSSTVPAPPKAPTKTALRVEAAPKADTLRPLENPAPTSGPVTASRPSAEEPAALRQRRSPQAPRSGPSVVSSSRPQSLALEVELIERARVAVTRNDAESALRELAEYERLSPPHALGAEADLVRVTALFSLGRYEQAEQLANELIRRHPGDAVARRAADVMKRFSK